MPLSLIYQQNFSRWAEENFRLRCWLLGWTLLAIGLDPSLVLLRKELYARSSMQERYGAQEYLTKTFVMTKAENKGACLHQFYLTYTPMIYSLIFMEGILMSRILEISLPHSSCMWTSVLARTDNALQSLLDRQPRYCKANDIQIHHTKS